MDRLVSVKSLERCAVVLENGHKYIPWVALSEVPKAKVAEAFDRKVTDYHVRLIRAVELAVCVCRKDPTPENAIRLCDVIDGLERE